MSMRWADLNLIPNLRWQPHNVSSIMSINNVENFARSCMTTNRQLLLIHIGQGDNPFNRIVRILQQVSTQIEYLKRQQVYSSSTHLRPVCGKPVCNLWRTLRAAACLDAMVHTRVVLWS